MQMKMGRAAMVASALLLMSAGVAGLARVAPRAQAATFTVTKTADTSDGTCDADCSLREAVGAANAAAGADTITLPAGTYTLTIPGAPEDGNAQGDLDVTGDLTINGSGTATTIIDGGGIDNVIEALGTAKLTMSDLTVRNGANSGVDAENGDLTLNGVVSTANGGLGAGTTNGNMALTDVTITNNGDEGINTGAGNVTIDGGEMSGNDGGINTFSGNVDLTDVSLHDNTSDGINTSSGDVTLVSSSIVANDGTGINTDTGNVDLTGVTISDNTGGDGINTSAGDVSLDSTTVDSNEGDGVNTSDGSITAVNSTITGNDGDNLSTSTGTIGLTNVTVADALDGDGIFNPDGITSMVNTIVAGLGIDCALAGPPSGDHNLDGDGSCNLSGTGDISNTDPMLGALADNGGSTKTRALLAGSPAIDAGTNTGCPAADQRGVARPVNGTCDMGAYEAGGAALPTSTSTPQAASTPCSASCPVQNTPTRTSTPAPTKASVPAATNTAAPKPAATKANTSGVAGLVHLPNTGAGRSQGAPVWLAWALLAAAAGAGLVAEGARRRRA